MFWDNDTQTMRMNATHTISFAMFILVYSCSFVSVVVVIAELFPMSLGSRVIRRKRGVCDHDTAAMAVIFLRAVRDAYRTDSSE
jgi:hypothetical protein